MAIDLSLASQKYSQNTPNSVNFWVQKATAKADEWERKAKSTQAEQNYAAGVQYAAQNQLRLKGLRDVTAQDYAQGINVGQTSFQAKTAASGDKWSRKFSPYAQVIDRVLPTLPPKLPGQGRQNLINRAGPIVEALQAAKLGGAVAAVRARAAGAGAGVVAPRRF